MAILPQPTLVYRLVHVGNLPTLLERRGLHAPNYCPMDGLPYRTIHDIRVQAVRHTCTIPCGPRGVIHDYVPFYFGPLSPMLYRLHTGWVEEYDEGQRPLLYLVTNCQEVAEAGLDFVFSDGHGLAFYSAWFDSLDDLGQVDWQMVGERFWADDPKGDSDRQRRKQAEFLVHQFCPWEVIRGIAVLDDEMKSRVEQILGRYPLEMRKKVAVRRGWYY